MTTDNYPKNYLYRRIVQAKLFIDASYPDKIEINNIADEAYFSRFHFIRLFKQIYGKTPHQYLTAVRIENAVKLFEQGQSISTVCFSVGFESLSSFSGLFKRLVGIAPSVFLAQAQYRKQAITAQPLQYIPGCFAYQHGWTKNSNFEEVRPSSLADLRSCTNQ
ncbi:MAG: AraC family transcriptional regulator [Chitinophagaceae bacterium]